MYKKAFQCAKDGTCPRQSGENGCQLWWEYITEANTIHRGCGLSQEILFTLLASAMNEAAGAAASADKATNAACEATLAAGKSGNAAMAGMALLLGLAGGQIKTPHPQLESQNGDENIPRRLGPIR